jgi:hypothetical protein
MADVINKTYLIQGTLALHWPVTFSKCRCGLMFPVESLMREHIAEQIAYVLEDDQ